MDCFSVFSERRSHGAFNRGIIERTKGPQMASAKDHSYKVLLESLNELVVP